MQTISTDKEHPSGHDDFAESTEEIAPLTEEEKAAKLQEMRAKLAEKRAAQAVIDREDAKKNEVSTLVKARTGTMITLTLAAENPNEVHQGDRGPQGGPQEEGAD
jgi:hypothetical protein